MLPDSSTLKLITDRTIDGDGHLTQVDVSGSNFTSFYIEYGTMTEDRYPVSVKNGETQVTGYDYDLRFGRPKTVTDPDANEVDIVYDPFGRVTSRTDVDGTATEISYSRCDVVTCPDVANALEAIEVTTTVKNGSTVVAPRTLQYFDILGREVVSQTEALNTADGWHSVHREYDDRGQLKYVSRPYFSKGTAAVYTTAVDCTKFEYDARGRLARETRPDDGITNISYAYSSPYVVQEVVETIKGGAATAYQTKENHYDALNQLYETIDAKGSTAESAAVYAYDPQGNLESVSVNEAVVAKMAYDLLGNRESIDDDNVAGYVSEFTFNGLGQVTQLQDAKGQVTKYTYDKLSRLTERKDCFSGCGGAPVVTNSWDWDATYATGQLKERKVNVSSTDIYKQAYTYSSGDALLTQIDTTIDVDDFDTSAQTFVEKFTYDSTDRVSTVEYKQGTTSFVTYTYAYTSGSPNADGFLKQIKNGSTVLQHFKETDAFGNSTLEEFHGGTFETGRIYDPQSGRLEDLETGSSNDIQDLVYQWRTDGSLYRRIDYEPSSAMTDTFTYDDLNRVTKQATTGGASREQTFAYSSVDIDTAYGNLASKESNVTGDLDVTDYTYDHSDKPYRLTAVTIDGVSNSLTYDANGNITKYSDPPTDLITIDYDGQNRVTQIDAGSDEDEFWYDPDGHRFLRKETWSGGSAVTAYIGAFEEVRESGDRIQRIVGSPNVVFVRVDDGSPDDWFEYIHRDHLGSIDAITDTSGNLAGLGKVSFDAFGGRREADWSSDASASTMTSIKGQQNERVSRGYTDHEHMNRTGFVHMNGRVYDPRIGRFLSPDPYVPHPMLSQSFNRYAYVLNRPLSLVDPSGFASLDPPICEPSCPAVYEPPDPNDDLFRFSPLDRWIVIQLHLQQFLWAQQQGQEQEQIAPEGTNAHQGGTGLTAFQIVYDFAYGVGPATRTFATGSTEVEAIRGIDQVNRARELFLRKVKDAGNPRDFSGITIVNCCTGLDFVDSLRDSGTSPLRQVVGNASNIMIFGGPNRTAFFTVLNRTSITSVSFDLLPSYDRDPSRSYPQPLSTIEQLFIFTETF